MVNHSADLFLLDDLFDGWTEMLFFFQAGDYGRVPYVVDTPADLADVLSCFPYCENKEGTSLLG
jgi:hypothetical protein